MVVSSQARSEKSPAAQLKQLDLQTAQVKPAHYTDVYFEPGQGAVSTPVYLLDNLSQGAMVDGPAVHIDNTQTIVITPQAKARLLETCLNIDLPSKASSSGSLSLPLEALDLIDDATPIKLKITINPEDGSAVFHFEGTGQAVYGNWDVPIAITQSAIIYSLRSPIDIRVPSPSVLSPSGAAAVVGGNVTTSQRVTDVVLKAFQACAASQGCLNNLKFGVEAKLDPDGNVLTPGWGYYETIAGGAGAGPSWVGESGVHVHMTNTRITDPEILEKRHPTVFREFGLR
ncbi:Uncharacterized protein Y057_14495 [Fusarium fujikuroi]|nr:Uncharacterized protein Y057_14495 [Fusarium fujikuroi]